MDLWKQWKKVIKKLFLRFHKKKIFITFLLVSLIISKASLMLCCSIKSYDIRTLYK